MTEIELIEYINKLETAFSNHLSEEKMEFWVKRFCTYHPDDFGRAIEHIIRTRERFPQLATMYTALREVNAGKPGRDNLIPAYPSCSYIDAAGHTSVWWNKTGQAFGNQSPADDAPEEYETDDGVSRLFNVAGDDKKAGERWKVYMKYQLGRNVALDEIFEKATRETPELDEAGIEKRKKELLEGVK